MVQAKSALTRVALVVAIAEPLMTLPQVWQICSAHSAAGVSLPTWIGYVLAAAVWLAYSISIKDKPLIVSSFLWVVTESLVVIGALQFR